VEKMCSAGSSREFFRINKDGKTAVLMHWDGGDGDWDYFITLNEIENLRDIIPTIIEAKRDENQVLVRDCGKFTLKDLFEKRPNALEYQKILLGEISEKLIFWQNVKVPETNIISKRIFAIKDLLWESDYFREHNYMLFPETKALFFSDDFEKERNEIAALVDKLPKCLMHRDFQSQNIVFDENKASFVDVQGARIGPCFYDAASLVFDPYLYPLMSEDLREYFLKKLRIKDRDSLLLCALQRLMQAIGAYGNLSQNKNKPHYKKYIFPASTQAAQICGELGKFSTLGEIFTIMQREEFKNKKKEGYYD